MSKISKSQWDFSGELFPVEATRQVLSVSEVTGQVRRLLEKQIGSVWITGEITNFRAQSSGHIYFTLKDAFAQLSCVLFKGEALAERALLQEGRKVVVRGEMTVYEPRGQYQLRVLAIELQGVGALQVAFEKLKQKLNEEGLFAPERKRPLPRFPQRIGLVTSATGAAIRDVIHVIERRNRGLEIILVPVRVQGEGAAAEIAWAIRLLNQFNSTISDPRSALDLIIVTRGGGSLEDLWAFNEEVLARAIFESKLPVVSAVGHEIDFTISDFVADFRAATPSAAAEIITEGVYSSCKFISEVSNWLAARTHQRLEREQRNFLQWKQRLVRNHPRRKLNDKLQRLDDLQTSLSRCVKHDVRKQQHAFKVFRERLWRVRPAQLLKQRRELLQLAQRTLHEQMRRHLQKQKNQLENSNSRLRLLSPEQVLARGYSITMDADSGKVIRSEQEVRSGQELRTRLHAGEIKTVVKK